MSQPSQEPLTPTGVMALDLLRARYEALQEIPISQPIEVELWFSQLVQLFLDTAKAGFTLQAVTHR